jgi:hypothetical protein
MTNNDFGFKPFESAEQVWVAAGWLVFVSRNQQGEVKQTVACHYATGKIVSIRIDDSMNQPWALQTLSRITEYK